MKVLIGGVMMATLAATSANAAITVEQRKAACEKSADKVWVDTTEACVPKNACNNSAYEAYCNRDFSDIHVASIAVASEMALMVRSMQDGIWGAEEDTTFDIDKNGKYLGHIVISRGKQYYKVYQFASLNERDVNVAKQGRREGLCRAANGTFSISPIPTCTFGSTTLVPGEDLNGTYEFLCDGLNSRRDPAELDGNKCIFKNI